jgi:para-nitrobenzyl esterase
MSPIVETSAGAVEGADADGVFIFRGVPYGGPVSGRRRFRPPTPVPPWDGVRPALQNGNACPQKSGIGLNSLLKPLGPPAPQGEDCLALNIFSPGLDDERRPVMVWLHGGGLTVGAGSRAGYDGHELARHGVVVVSINHRLGFLGWLHLAELAGEKYADSGNAGTLDMIAALEWVRDNIDVFGGDPGNVTIFGESGGGYKVSTLLASRRAEGLFHRAVVQSGPQLTAIEPRDATAVAEELMSRLNVTSVEQLAEVPAEELVATGFDLLGSPLGGKSAPCGPVLDGRTIQRHMFEPDAAPASLNVPLLIGTCKDEMTLFNLGEAGLRASAARVFGDGADQAADVYRKGRPSASDQQVYSAMATDRLRVGSIRMAERRVAASDIPVYMFRFDYESPLVGGTLGAPHGIEVPFVFDNLNGEHNLGLHGERPDAQQLAQRVSEAWVAFAKTGDPSHPGLPSWPSYDERRRGTMIFDSECHVVDDPDGEERAAWDGVSSYRM